MKSLLIKIILGQNSIKRETAVTANTAGSVQNESERNFSFAKTCLVSRTRSKLKNDNLHTRLPSVSAGKIGYFLPGFSAQL